MENKPERNFKTGWNWGAFVDPIGFGVGNKAYLTLLSLIPVFGWVWIFFVGNRAERWALENLENDYRDEEEFRKIMDTWKRGGFINFWIAVASFALIFIIYFIIILAIITQIPQDQFLN